MHEIWWCAHATCLEPTGVLGQRRLASVPACMDPAEAAEVLSTDRQSATVLLPGPPPLLVKWRRPHSLRRRVRAFLRPSRERREAAAALRARARGIPCPAPLAVGERRAFGRLVGSVLVRPYFPQMVPADRALAQADPSLPALLARTLGDWHDRGFRHGDCYPKNVLVNPRSGEAWPIGCPAARFPPPGTRLDRARGKDLAQWAWGLGTGEGEDLPLDFLAAYGAGRGPLDLDRLAALVAPRLRRLRSKKARREASRPRREPHGPPPPEPLEDASGAAVRRRVLPLGRLTAQ